MQPRRGSNEMSPTDTVNTNDVRNTIISSDDESSPVQRTKKRLQQFSDSDSENENVRLKDNKTDQEDKSESDCGTENSSVPFKSGKTMSRIQMDGSSSDSDASSRNESTKEGEQQMRVANKRNKLKDKFKGLLSSRGKRITLQDNDHKHSSEGSHGKISDASDNEMSSTAKIKQKIKKSMASMSSICDPDTSDEEGQMNKKQMPKQRQNKQQKSTKLIEAKPVRMSAKQAMENMQLIKSESNRMLREKAVSLPYHRPKALSLKDIMSRRKPAVALDGKALPIKMNEEQLKHYALLLEQRQKEMMELCKSESDEETPEAEEKSEVTQQEIETVSEITNNESEVITEKTYNTIECAENESITNKVAANNDIAYSQLIENESVETTTTEGNNLSIKVINEKPDSPGITTNQQEQNDSNTDFKLVYNDSVEEEHLTTDNTENVAEKDTLQEKAKNDLENHSEQQLTKVNSETESQLISLHYTENNTEEPENLKETEKPEDPLNEITETVDIAAEENKKDDFFSDDDVNMEDIDRIIENAEILRDDDIVNSPMLIRDPLPLNAKPTLTGAPGMVIDLDGGSCLPKKTGVELLKERFTYFARLKTPEEIEREKEKKLKPGAQHLKLKHELEEKIAEQRSLEWAKRLEEEKQQHTEMDTILDDAEDSFEKIEQKLEEENEKDNESSSESEEEEPEENDIEIKDEPRKHNPMLDDEAEESDIEENEAEVANVEEANEVFEDCDDNVEQENEEDDTSDDESSESEEEERTKTKKGRILKAFEDSDDEDASIKQVEPDSLVTDSNKMNDVDAAVAAVSNEVQSGSQDDVIQLAQRHASVSDDLFTSQESTTIIERTKEGNSASDEVMTQTFSILDSTSGVNMDMDLKSPSKLNVLCMSQPYKDPNINCLMEGSQLPITQSSQSQPIGEDILALCTGKFYDNEFVTPTEEKQYVDDMSHDLVNNDTQTAKTATNDDISKEVDETVLEKENDNKQVNVISKKADGTLLKDILDELDDPEFDKPKANKFFTGGNTQKKDGQVLESTQLKKKFTIDSDDDDEEPAKTNKEITQGKKKQLKKRKPEKRALQISDDEDEEEEEIAEDDEYVSDLEDDAERLVEYDSEENEIEIKPDKPKKKRKVADFFEQEAELTSEDEWVGSGDEDEKGLDRMEREEGDDEVFHQGQLRKELGQIHMRDVLDQDKREVRIIQELLFEDGDLGDGHRQRKFRWRNAGEEDATGTVPDEFADTQEEEFESEELWRKQRHEREVFLKTMQQEEEEAVNVSVNRTTIIKANLSSKSMSTLLQEVNQSKTETESPIVQEKKTAKDIPSPKKSFSIFQQNYHGSLLTRGRGALARLAALATPLAADDDAPKIGSLASHKRNFVFTALTQDDDVPKVTIKRKADVNLGTPKLVKKMKIEEKLVRPKSSLLDHF